MERVCEESLAKILTVPPRYTIASNNAAPKTGMHCGSPTFDHARTHAYSHYYIMSTCRRLGTLHSSQSMPKLPPESIYGPVSRANAAQRSPPSACCRSQHSCVLHACRRTHACACMQLTDAMSMAGSRQAGPHTNIANTSCLPCCPAALYNLSCSRLAAPSFQIYL